MLDTSASSRPAAPRRSTLCITAPQALLVVVARRAEPGADVRLAVVGVGPRPWLERAGLEAQRHLGEDAVAQVDAMSLILCRRQQELAQDEDTGIEIQRPFLGKRAGRRKGLFEAIRVQLHVG